MADDFADSVKSAKSNFLTNALPNILLNNPRKFWNVVNPTGSSRILLTNLYGEPIDDEECPSMLSNVFSNVFRVFLLLFCLYLLFLSISP